MIDKALEDSQLPVLNDPQAPSGKPKLANLISDIALPPWHDSSKVFPS